MQENAKPEPINRNLESLGLLSEGGGGRPVKKIKMIKKK